MGIALIVLAGCGRGFQADQYPNPTALLEAAKAEYRRGDCADARIGFQGLSLQLAARDPLQAEIRYFLAECTLRDGEYLEAARQFRRVADEFPQHALAPDALLRAGAAFAELWKRPELDPSYGQNAIDVWRELMGRFPGSTAAERARLRVRELNEMFAAKDYKNGEFYLRLRAYDSAIIYFQGVVAEYPQSSFAPKAVLKLIEAFSRIGYEAEKRDMCNYLRQYYPQSYSDAEECPSSATQP